MATPYDDWKANDREGDAWQAQSEAVSLRVSEMHKDPEWIEKALNEIDCDYTDELMALRVKAQIAPYSKAFDAWADLNNFEAARVAEYLLKFAKAEIEGARAKRCAQTADMFADKFNGNGD